MTYDTILSFYVRLSELRRIVLFIDPQHKFPNAVSQSLNQRLQCSFILAEKPAVKRKKSLQQNITIGMADVYTPDVICEVSTTSCFSVVETI